MPTVLVVEDLEPTRRAIAIFLERRGHKVLQAPSGLTGLALARAERPDLVLLDIGLPDLSGYQVCRNIKADSDIGGTRILLMSALFLELRDRVEGLLAGAEDMVTHPTTMKAIAEVAEAVLAGTHRLDKPLDRALAAERRGLWDEAVVGYRAVLADTRSQAVKAECQQGLDRVARAQGKVSSA